MAFTRILNKYFDLYSNEITGSDDFGGVVRTPILKEERILCHVSYKSGQEKSLYGKINIDADYILCCDMIEVKTTDLIYLDGDKYTISYIHSSGLERDHHLEILIKSINAPKETKYESGWTWGEENPVTQLPLVWTTWTFRNTLIEARNTGDYGQLQVRGLEKFVSEVIDTGWKKKEVHLSYDDYDVGDHNCFDYIYYRSSNTEFEQDDVLPEWYLYGGKFTSSNRYFQLMVGCRT